MRGDVAAEPMLAMFRPSAEAKGAAAQGKTGKNTGSHSSEAPNNVPVWRGPEEVLVLNYAVRVDLFYGFTLEWSV